MKSEKNETTNLDGKSQKSKGFAAKDLKSQGQRNLAMSIPTQILPGFANPIDWLHPKREHKGTSLSKGIFQGGHRNSETCDSMIITCFINQDKILKYIVGRFDFHNNNLIEIIRGDIDRGLSEDDLVSFCADTAGNCLVFYSKTINEQKMILYRTGHINSVEGEIVWSHLD